MRILVVTAPLPWDLSNGASLVLHHQLRILASRHEIMLIGAGAPERERLLRGDGRALPSGLAMRWFGTRVPGAIDHAVRRVRSLFSGEPAHVHWVERRGLARAFAEALERRPDVVHLHGWGTAQLSRLSGGVRCVHVPMDAWTVGMKDRALPGWRSTLERSQLPKIAAHERRHYPRCAAVVVVAEGDAEQIRRLVPEARVEVVPNGVELGSEPGIPSSEPVIGFHGAFVNQANRDAAIFLAREVFPIVRRVRPDARLLLIGRDPTPEIRAFASDVIDVTGSVPDVRVALAKVAVYVAPMVSGTGIKNKVLEAMAAALPVVATPQAIDGIGEGPGVRTGATAESLAGHVVDLLASDEERRALGKAARAYVASSFTWERNAEAIEALWTEFAP